MSNYPLAISTWDNKELEAIQSVIDSDNYTMGEHVTQFENDFGKFINRKYCLMVSSGSAANLISIASFFYTKNPMLKKGDEVIIPAICWSTSLWPIVQAGLKPIFVDDKDLIRLGSIDDGGYVVPIETIKSSTALISFGISDNWDFEKDFLRKSSAYLVSPVMCLISFLAEAGLFFRTVCKYVPNSCAPLVVVK